jgi:hypothetical protein
MQVLMQMLMQRLELPTQRVSLALWIPEDALDQIASAQRLDQKCQLTSVSSCYASVEVGY